MENYKVPEHISSVVKSYLEELDYRSQNQGKPLGLYTGIKVLDDKMGGMRGGEVILLGARPAMGKIPFVISIMRNVAQTFWAEDEKKCVLFFSLDCSGNQIVQKLLSWEMRVSVCTVDSYDGSERLESASEEIAGLPIYICDTSYLIEDMKDKIKHCENVGFIVIDCLQMVKNKENQYKTIGDYEPIMQEIKCIAKGLNVPILVLSQLNADVESRKDKRPSLSDIQQYANHLSVDKVLFLYREYYYLCSDEPQLDHTDIKNECEIIVAKNRYGATGGVKFGFDIETWTFSDL